jgi:hypothetical protein
MNKNTNGMTICRAIIVCLFTVGYGYGGIVAPQSLVDLERNADFIAVGSASGAIQSGSQITFSLKVIRVVKGQANLAGTSISGYWNSGTVSLIGDNTADLGSGMWFFKESGALWQVLPVIQGGMQLNTAFFPEPSDQILSAYAYAPLASLNDKIASEISSAVESSPNYNFQLNYLNYGLLDELNSPVTTMLYTRMAASGSARQQLLGLSGLIRGGSEVALTSASKTTSTFDSYPAESSVLLSSIRDFFRPTNPDAAVAVGRVAVDSTIQSLAFRQASAHALAAIHTTAALPYLGLLLSDPDATLRAEGIGGMAAFANGLSTQTNAAVPSLAHMQLPANAPYRTSDTIAHFALGSQTIERREEFYLSFWKQWWSKNQASLGF